MEFEKKSFDYVSRKPLPLLCQVNTGVATKHAYSKTCFKRPFKKKTKLVFDTDYRLLQDKSIAECSKGSLMKIKSIAECLWSILQYFRPSLSYHFPFSILGESQEAFQICCIRNIHNMWRKYKCLNYYSELFA